jgi:antitoxin component YwqK of YwqJK toxin-antitoxin module
MSLQNARFIFASSLIALLVLGASWGEAAAPPGGALSKASRPPAADVQDKTGADKAPDPLLYEIPKDAIEKQRSQTSFQYMDRQAGQVVGERIFKDDRNGPLLKEKVLYRGQLHGVQREWYPNGQIKSTSAYRLGVMDGIFAFWSASGKRTGYDKIENGKGVLRHYYENGRPMSETHFKNSLRDGPFCDFYNTGQMFTLQVFQADKQKGEGFTFWQNGVLQSWWFCDEDGITVGPIIILFDTGKVSHMRFDLKDAEVDEKTYKAAAEKDPTLPPFSKDPEFFKKKVTREIQDLIAKYKALPPVKIPIGPEGPVPQVEEATPGIPKTVR